MERTIILPGILPAVLAFAAVAWGCAPVAAQTDRDASAPQPRHVRKSAQHPMLFSPGAEKTEPADSVQFRAYERMSEQDRDLAADAEAAIGERAGFAGLEFNQGKWSYRQIVCSALPRHLFLQFTRNNGRGDVSLFSASIPRPGTGLGDGRVRIIPIVRRGYSLFSPAPINALTISAFNHVRAEENSGAETSDAAPDWLATGLCYAALAGAHPQIGPAEQTDFKKLPAAPTGRMVAPERGGAVISFTDVAAARRPMLWTMTFNGKGKLLKATHSAAPRSGEMTVERTPAEVQGKPVQASDPEVNAILIR